MATPNGTGADGRGGAVRPHVEPGTVVLYTDVMCGWSTVALHRFYRARAEEGTNRPAVDHRTFLLEEVNRFPIPKRLVESELATFTELEPELGWSMWQGPDDAWPVSSLLANAAVWAAKGQGPAAAEQLDWELRMAFFRDSRCITMRHVIEDVARSCHSVDADAVMDELMSGRPVAAMWDDLHRHRDAVQGSPHFFLPDGSDVASPGLEKHWSGGDEGQGFPMVDRNDPSAIAAMVQRACTAVATAARR